MTTPLNIIDKIKKDALCLVLFVCIIMVPCVMKTCRKQQEKEKQPHIVLHKTIRKNYAFQFFFVTPKGALNGYTKLTEDPEKDCPL